MKLDKLARSILKSIVYMMDEAATRVDRVSDRASDFADRTHSVIYPNEGSTLRHFMSFAAGIGVGIAAGMLLAPSSGEELRNNIGDKVHNIGDKFRGHGQEFPTGTEVR